MDSQVSVSREHDDDIDQLCRSLANTFLSPAREAASRAKNLPIKSTPRPLGFQDCNTSKQHVSGGADSSSVTSRTQRTKASQSRTLRTPPTLATTDPQRSTAGREAINPSPNSLRKPSSTQRTAARQSLIIRLPLPQGMLGLQNGASSKNNEDNHSSQFEKLSRVGGEEACPRNIPPIPARVGFLGQHNVTATSLIGDLSSTPFTTLSSAYRKKARQSTGVLILDTPKRKRRNQLNVRPIRFKMRSRAQEAVFKEAESLLALEHCATRSFFRLPAELRLKIYEYALTSQSTITPRLDGAQKVESKKSSADAAEGSTQVKASSLALLQTCRLVAREARPVYYANNTFRFTSAKDLNHFLRHTEPGLLNELRKLHIEGLATRKPTFTEEYLETRRRAGMSDALHQELASIRSATLGDDAIAAGRMFSHCKRLHRIRFSIGRKEETSHINWLRMIAAYSNTIVEFVHDDYWVLRSAAGASTFEWYAALTTALIDPASHRALFPILEEGKQRCIDVDLALLKKEIGSGVGQRAIRKIRKVGACG